MVEYGSNEHIKSNQKRKKIRKQTVESRVEEVNFMIKKSVSIVILTLFSLLTFSCYTQKIVKVNEIKNNRGKILAVVTTGGDWIELPGPGKIIDDEIVYQTTAEGQKKMASIPLLRVKRVWLKRFSTKYLLESLIVLPPFCLLAWLLIRNTSR
jgi:hypothetical protein